MSRFRRAVLRRYRSRLDHLPCMPVDEGARTLVFAPHQDDETLGCGGTIALKRRAGASVRVVFMCDGTSLNKRLMEPARLSAIRECEAIAAAATLGLDHDALDFVRLPEGRLRRHPREALEHVARSIERMVPDEIYLPYRKDPHGDHIATAAVVLEAVRAQRHTIRLFEYPIWLWSTWPWVATRFGLNRWRAELSLWRNTVHARFGRRFLREFTHAIDIAAVAEVKRAALDRHETQMTRYLPDPGWITLGDVRQGAFLENFLRQRELFRASVHRA